MRVAMVNTARSKGGAARVASLLAQTFHDQFDDFEVTLFHCEDRLREPPFQGLRRPLSRLVNAFLARLGGSTLVYDMGVAKEIIARTREADILHLHNLHGYYLDYLELLRAWKDRPVVWTLHDMWSLTGRCGFSFECDKWYDACQSCPHKQYYPKSWIDRANREFKTKTAIYSSMDRLTLVSPSQWLSDLAIGRGFPREAVHVVPNPIDAAQFDIIDKNAARQELDLPQDDFIALFVAANCGDPRKGYSDFAYAVRQSGCCGVAVGKRPPKPAKYIRHTGMLFDRSTINRYYCAADVFVIPSYADNYPNTALEALVCGTPVVAYDQGGIPSQADLPGCYLVATGHQQSLVDALWKSAISGGKNNDMALSLAKKAQKRWHFNYVSKNYYRIYRICCDR